MIFQMCHDQTKSLAYGFLFFIQYFARNWPWYSLRGLHIRITWFSLYGIRIPLFSLYCIHMPLLPYMVIQPIVLGMTLLWAAMDSSLSQGPLLWRHNDMTVIVSRNTRGRERDTQQRECTVITDRQSSHSLWDSTRFVAHFWEITPYILRDAIVVLVQPQCYSINVRPFPRTPYRVDGLAGDVMRAWVSHSLVYHWIYNFKA